jgi:hypothetical protein
MTEIQYKELQKWCQKNKKHPDYNKNVLLRNEATSIRNSINGYNNYIKNGMYILEACKDEEKINKWLDIINGYKAKKDIQQKKFSEL